ncbi:unnamed protein product [Knipowitschia caucasica]|uniref:C3H1-type domain-containing protein n=1 Tax=Knipowitschia caucasica TaxID=637954 RepID=A0AAV2LLF8_KNICA
MNALVGYGVSSGSDSDGEAPEEHDRIRSSQEVCPEPVKSRNLLLEADCGSESSESEELEEEQRVLHRAPTRRTLPSPTLSSGLTKLPPPSLQTCSDTSVFTNPFKAQQDQKLSALQKHVPLTEQARPSHIGGRRVCVSYRKEGRCRFGIKCKYAHDSDLQTAPMDSVKTSKDTQTRACGARGPQGSQHDPEDKPEVHKVTKRKVGLSNTLIPPKRALKQYAMQRGKEGSHI